MPTSSPQTSALSHTEDFSLHQFNAGQIQGGGLLTQSLEDPESLNLVTLPPSRGSGVKQDLRPPMSVLFPLPLVQHSSSATTEIGDSKSPERDSVARATLQTHGRFGSEIRTFGPVSNFRYGQVQLLTSQAHKGQQVMTFLPEPGFAVAGVRTWVGSVAICSPLTAGDRAAQREC